MDKKYLQGYADLTNSNDERNYEVSRERLIEMIDGVLAWGADHDEEFRECLVDALGITDDEYEILFDENLDTYLGEEDEDDEEEPDLPDSLTLNEDVVEDFDYDDGDVDDDSLQECIDDYLSDEYGYCINEYNYKCHYNEDGKLIRIDIYNIDWDLS